MTTYTRNGHVIIHGRFVLNTTEEREGADYITRRGVHMADVNIGPKNKQLFHEEHLTPSEHEVFDYWGFRRPTDIETITGWFADYRLNFQRLRVLASERRRWKRNLADDAANITTAVNRLGG